MRHAGKDVADCDASSITTMMRASFSLTAALLVSVPSRATYG